MAGTDDRHTHLLAILKAALDAADPRRAVESSLVREACCLRLHQGDGSASRTYDLSQHERVLVVGCGKASVPMARAAMAILGDNVHGGCVVTKYEHAAGARLDPVTLCEAAHPRPDEAGTIAARKVLQVLNAAGPRDLVVALISGGGSALWPLPAEGISLEEKMAATDALLACGADIVETNCARKHISAIKGGLAAKAAYPATVAVLAVSDVIGDPLDVIASGPFHPDSSTYGDAAKVVEKYNLQSHLPQRVLERLERGSRGEAPETPKPGDGCFEKVSHALCATNTQAIRAAAEAATALGYDTHILTTSLQGDVSDAGRYLASEARKAISSNKSTCLVSGGETTVTLGASPGRGGRNQQLALDLALRMRGVGSYAALSCGTDGTDGPTDAAGAIVDDTTLDRANARGLDPQAHLQGRDAYPFFESLGDLVKTGPTGTNVMDIQVFITSNS